MNVLSTHNRIRKDMINSIERSRRNPPRWSNGEVTGPSVPGGLRRLRARLFKQRVEDMKKTYTESKLAIGARILEENANGRTS